VRQSAKCPTTVYVKNLAFNVDDESLTKHFELRGGGKNAHKNDQKWTQIWESNPILDSISFGYSILEEKHLVRLLDVAQHVRWTGN
jgi:RNA recognition motif-containing protein